MDSLTLHFLGTGGGRHAMCTQRRKTAGIRIIGSSSNIHIDPGPGALVHSIYAGLTPMRLDGVVVTHCHPDHYTDAEALIEAMTQGTTRRRGVLAAAKSVILGGDDMDFRVSRYHQRLPQIVETLTPGSRFRVGNLEFEALKALHGDSDAVSLRLKSDDSSIGYTSDTELYPGIKDGYEGLRLLVMCTMWPRGRPLKGHLCTDDALTLIREARPRCAVTTHFGIRALNGDPGAEAEWLQGESGVPVVAAVDGMTLTLQENIVVKGPRKSDSSRVIEA